MSLQENHWQKIAQEWSIRSDTTYLNHGSFGPAPTPVTLAKRDWQQRLEEQPMDFYVRHFETAWLEARNTLANFLRCDANNLIFVENATVGMNVVANSLSLEPGDRIVLTDHEYGAVRRIWDAACERANGLKGVGGNEQERAAVHVVPLPDPILNAEQVVESLFTSLPSQTRLLVVSHITSATAIHLPVTEICQRAAREGISVCIDGPHAPLHVDLNLSELACDFYTASCHKWLCAPLGSGFLYVDPGCQSLIRPTNLSWGRIMPAEPREWFEQFMWTGTRDPSAYFAVPNAIQFFETLGMDAVRRQIYGMAQEACERLLDLLGTDTLAPADSNWYGAMAHVRLPTSDARDLQSILWQKYRIEVPIIHWSDRWFIRVSCHLYNSLREIDALIEAVDRELIRAKT